YFDFHQHRYLTTFGGEGVRAHEPDLELSFNVVLKRKFLDPFVSRVLPMFVVAVLLFAVLYVGSKREHSRSDLVGFKAVGVVGSCTGLFFVVTAQHISLHSSIGSDRIVYFEYFYFTTYLVLMGVCVNAILFAT